MKRPRVFVTGMGVISPGGRGVMATRNTLLAGICCLKPLSNFPLVARVPLPVGEIKDFETSEEVPRTHALALCAAREALLWADRPPDAVIFGITTGGSLTTEELLKAGEQDPAAYRWHGFGTVTSYVAGKLGCPGPTLTVSTACSSGAMAIAIGTALIRSGRAERVLAGGADCLCRMTYHGFNSLQIIDPTGAKPMDLHRQGMSIAEGAGMLLLEGGERAPGRAWAEVLGFGLSCDAYHPTAPHPEGAGAFLAMSEALQDAGLDPSAVEYINLHGTGTIQSDAAEAKAIAALFGPKGPPVSSIKGGLGHLLGAAGAVEAIASILALHEGFLPPNVGSTMPDPACNVTLVQQMEMKKIAVAASNSFGFGGNNATLIFGDPERVTPISRDHKPCVPCVKSAVCLSGQGLTDASFSAFTRGESISGLVSSELISEGLPPAQMRRLKRIFHLVLKLSLEAQAASGLNEAPGILACGTAWGALTESRDFLHKLFTSNEQFPSPTDFINSGHNSPAGQAAILFKTNGPNITACGGSNSFEQALLMASAIGREGQSILLISAEEWHPVLSPLFDPLPAEAVPSDGGGAFMLRLNTLPEGIILEPVFYQSRQPGVIDALIGTLGGSKAIKSGIGAVFVGWVPNTRNDAQGQLDRFIKASSLSRPVIDYRRLIGHSCSASAVMAVMAVRLLSEGVIPAALAGGARLELRGRDILLLGLGDSITAVRVRQAGA